MSTHITIFGATSGIGQCAVDEALRRDHTVRAFARSAGDMASRPGLEPYPGDALDPASVAGALKGTDAVIYALGIKESVSMLWKEVTLFSKTTRILLDAMQTAGVTRLVAVTGFGAGRSREAMSSLEIFGHKAILGKPYADKDRQETLIMDSPLDWTIARPVILTKSTRTGSYNVLREPKAWRNGLISRADTACYLIDAVENGLDIRADVVLAR
ncbi:NAD(P)-dependent oxidoreductase [Roseovarius sp. B08]|uniref:NAD(P)-dependent oxidoreductase n=1 Tax=Roseovarius sp. B08 TaxID=3449223 RepID=UPI003EDCB212